VAFVVLNVAPFPIFHVGDWSGRSSLHGVVRCDPSACCWCQWGDETSSEASKGQCLNTNEHLRFVSCLYSVLCFTAHDCLEQEFYISVEWTSYLPIDTWWVIWR